METGIVMDIDHFAVHDGPGIRTCLFLKGCPLTCLWCHSPESQLREPQILFAQNRCVKCGLCAAACENYGQILDEEGNREYRRENCRECRRCVESCPTGALFVSGTQMSVTEAAAELIQDKLFYKNSGGGVTISGGECLLQPVFTKQLLMRMKAEGIHTIVETSGCGKKEDLLALADYTDTFYYDFKLADPAMFEKYTGGNLNTVRENLEALREKTDRIVLRIPLIPYITDTMENVKEAYKTAQRLEIRQIHLLPYNQSAGAKYEWCGRNDELGDKGRNTAWAEELCKAAPREIEATIMK